MLLYNVVYVHKYACSLPLMWTLYVIMQAFSTGEYLKSLHWGHTSLNCLIKRQFKIPWISQHQPLRTQVRMWIKIASCYCVLITLERHISITNQPANTITGIIMWPGSLFFSDYVPTAALCRFWFHFFFFFFLYLHTNVWNVTTKPSWMSRHRFHEGRRGKWEEKLLISLPLACNFHPLSTAL